MNRPAVIRLRLFHFYGAIIALGAATLCGYSYRVGVTAQAYEIALFLTIIMVMSAAYGLALWQAMRDAVPFRAMLLWAAVFRLTLLPSQPILDAEYDRILWDGAVLAEGVNPYQYTPQDILDAFASDEAWSARPSDMRRLLNLARQDERLRNALNRIDNPDIPSTYPPFAQILFGVSAAIAPGSMWAWRGIILFFDCALIASISLVLRALGRNPSMTLAYAWSPLILKEYINSLHADIVALAILFLAVLLACTAKKIRLAATMACAALGNLSMAALIPFWSKDWRAREWGCFIGVGALVLTPFSDFFSRSLALDTHRSESDGFVFGAFMRFLESLGVPARNIGGILASQDQSIHWDAFFLAQSICVATILLLVAWLAWRSWRNPLETSELRLRRAFWVVGAILILGPIVGPWRIGWVMPFLCFFPSVSWLYLSVSCFSHYLIFVPELNESLAGVRDLHYLPFFALLAWEGWRARRELNELLRRKL